MPKTDWSRCRFLAVAICGKNGAVSNIPLELEQWAKGLATVACMQNGVKIADFRNDVNLFLYIEHVRSELRINDDMTVFFDTIEEVMAMREEVHGEAAVAIHTMTMNILAASEPFACVIIGREDFCMETVKWIASESLVPMASWGMKAVQILAAAGGQSMFIFPSLVGGEHEPMEFSIIHDYDVYANLFAHRSDWQ